MEMRPERGNAPAGRSCLPVDRFCFMFSNSPVVTPWTYIALPVTSTGIFPSMGSLHPSRARSLAIRRVRIMRRASWSAIPMW